MPTLSRTLAAGFAAVAMQAFAAPVAWNTWVSDSAGSVSAEDTTVVVAFTTMNPHEHRQNYPSWTPAASFADGVLIDNGPAQSNGIMRLIGGSAAVNTLTFSTAVVNPVISIWSLGQPGSEATFEFNTAPLLASGGPNAEYAGGSLVVAGTTVSGMEGSGTLQFVGTFTSLSWINPIAEEWFGFNVGVAGVAPAVPEPGTLALGLLGVMTVARATARRR